MPKVIVITDDGTFVARFEVPAGHIPNGVWRNLTGRLDTPYGWLGRALRDANVIQAGGDPERPSEKAMRLSEPAIRKLREERQAQ